MENDIFSLLITFIIGFIGGTAGGLLGIGGGTLFVPALTLIQGIEQSIAQGISLAAVIVTAMSATSRNISKNIIDKDIVMVMIVPVVIAAVIGAQIAGSLDQESLRKIFGFILITVALKNIASLLMQKT
ncbi:MAG: hypothetical protein CL710_03240 [Chloroflexi bacterium]|nr:hypothetical protein [Chloroflexota bacterium]|tara:strand:- start:5685 stop:6071 length:387 start_codon:yes stop_codon:yes gene_type:complete